MSFLRPWFVLVIATLPLLGATELGPGAPVVIVYPLVGTGDIGAQSGSSVGTAIANKLVQLGGITVKPYTAGTARPQYLTAALAESADYYITGYLTPLGSEVSVVEQVVSTRTGSIVYSTTAFARTYADAVEPAESLRQAILHHAGRGMAALDAPPPPSPSPDPIAGKGGVNILKAFGRHRKDEPTPGASASAASAPGAGAAAPAGPAKVVAQTAVPAATGATPARVAAAGTARTTLVITASGTTDAAAREYASQSLASALRRSGTAGAYLAVSKDDVSAHAADLCRANAAAGFYVPTLAIATAGRGASVTLSVETYDCNAAPIGTERATGSAKTATRAAIENAVDAAAADIARATRATSRR